MAASMDESVVEMPVEVEILKENKAKKGILNSFGKLAEARDEIREKAVVDIVSKLAQKTANVGDDEPNSELDYCLERLVRGLASSRQAARLGFYVALVEILRKFETVKPSRVTELMTKHLTNPQQGKQEINPLIATAFACGALIRSERLSEDPQTLQHVCEELLSLYSQKDFLQELCTTFLVEMFGKVEVSLFAKHAWPSLKSHFTSGWSEVSDCSPNTLWMMLVLSQKQKKSVNEKFLSKHWQGKELLTTKNFKKIAEICVSSTKSNPRVHPLCKHVLSVLSDTEHFAEFWKTLVEVAMDKQQKEKQYLLFELLKESLEHHLTSSGRVTQLLLPSVMQTFITNLAHREMQLHQAAVQLSKTISQVAVKLEDGATQFKIMKCLLTNPGSVMLDQLTRTTMIAGILPHLKPEAVNAITALLHSIFNCSSSKKNGETKSSEKPIESEAHRAAALRMITQLTSQSANGHHEVVLQYLAFHAFFNQHGQSAEIPQCSEGPFDVGQGLHDVARECFYRLLSVAPKRLTANHGSTLLQHHCDVLDCILSFVKVLLKNPAVASPCTTLGDEAQEAFQTILKKVKSVKKKSKHESQSSKAQAFQVLFLNLALQLFVDEKHTLGILQDLYVCCDKAFPEKASKKKKDDGEPPWIEVVVDLLLSLLSKNSQPLRTVANNVFLLLVPHFTVSALQQILDVIDPSKDDESVMENESSNEDSAGSSSDGESDDEGDEDKELDDRALALKRSLKAALGDAAEDSEDDNEEKEETYLDDAAMERVDESLAQVFRTMRRRKSGLSAEDEALLHFRNRCLEVLGLIVSSRPSIPFILPSLFTALSALEFGHNEKHQESLGASAANCLRRFFAIKKFQLEDSSSEDLDFKDILSQLISRFQTVTDHKLFVLLADVCTFVFRCALHCDGKDKQCPRASSCISVYKDSLKDYIRKSECHIPERLFLTVINTYSSHSWEFADVLLECAFDEGIRLFKRSRALSLMTALASHHADVRQSEKKDIWTSFSQTCIREISKSVDAMMSAELKPHSINKMLQLTLKIVSVEEGPKGKNPECKALLSTIGLLADKNLPKESKKLIGKITNMLTKPTVSGEKRKGSAEGKKSKKMKAK